MPTRGNDDGETREESRFCLVLIANVHASACEIFQNRYPEACDKCEYAIPAPVAFCIGCGCSDRHACVAPVTGACFWIKVDRELGIGVCSECPERVDLFEAWQNHAHHGEPTRRPPIQSLGGRLHGDAGTRGTAKA